MNRSAERPLPRLDVRIGFAWALHDLAPNDWNWLQDVAGAWGQSRSELPIEPTVIHVPAKEVLVRHWGHPEGGWCFTVRKLRDSLADRVPPYRCSCGRVIYDPRSRDDAAS